ncbi:MAG: UpxY family transcription antiterminator [Terriglobia bacterium]|jgi:transcription antitermination factor NusG
MPDAMAGENSTAGPSWYALYTRAQHEKVVAQALSSKGFEILLPLYRAVHRWKDRSKQLALPLFPGYVFILGGLDRRLEIVSTPGLHTYVTVGGRPAPIPGAEIEAVKRTVLECACVEPYPFLKSGDWVRVTRGPLEGIEGVLVRKKNQFRLVLSVQLLQQAVAVEVDVSMVERAPRAGVADPRLIWWEKGYASASA